MSLYPTSQYIDTYSKHEDLQLNTLKVDQDVSWEGKDNLIASVHKKDLDDLCTSLQSFLDNQASVGGNHMPTESMETPHCEPADEVGLTEKESETHSRKAVTKIKVPQVILCFNDGASQVVKDICIDEGLHPLDKKMLDKSEVTERISSVLKSYVKRANDDPGGKMDNGSAEISNDIDSKTNIEENTIDNKSSWRSSETGEVPSVVDENTSNIREKKFSLEELFSMPETDIGPLPTEQEKRETLSKEEAPLCTTTSMSSVCDSNYPFTAMPSKEDVNTEPPIFAATHPNPSGGEETPVSLREEDHSINTLLQSNVVITTQCSDINQNDAIDKIDTGVNDTDLKDAETGTLPPIDAPESSQAIRREESTVTLTGEDNSINTLLQSDAVFSGQGSNIQENDTNSEAIDTDSRAGLTTVISSEESRADKDRERLLDSCNPSVTEETDPESTTACIGSSFHKNSEELNFPGPSYLLGPKVCSGHIAFSGSISHRSDSSTTSTRSFAFPILHSEWNYSPVKMVKADGRHLRKHRCWGFQLLCCRF